MLIRLFIRTMIITQEWLSRHRGPTGAYNKRQIELLGLKYPLHKGWKEDVVGKELSEEKAMEFERSAKPEKGVQSILKFASSVVPDEETQKPLLVRRKVKPQPPQNARCIYEGNEAEYAIDYFVYTDGSCINNGTDAAIAGIGVYFGENDPRNVSKRVVGRQTNNVAELQAIIEVYDIVMEDIYPATRTATRKNICIVSDSYYAIHCITSYGDKQREEGWKKDIPNKELVKYAYELYLPLTNVYFMQVKGHTQSNDVHSIGNDGADRLANQAIGISECPYAASSNNKTNGKIYLKVPFMKKDEVKSMGAKWDPDAKSWYISESNPNKDVLLESYERE